MTDTTSSRIDPRWLIGVAAAFAIFALIADYAARMTQDYEGFDAQRAAARYDTLHKLRDDARKTLTTADWVDQDKGTVRIPIQEAMTREIDTLKTQPAAVGQVIPGTQPAPAPATNAAPAAPTAPPNPGPAKSEKTSPPKTNAAPANAAPPATGKGQTPK